nr:MAG TPA: ERF superfamily protein [Caudoviricetes sp.]
MTIYEKLAKIQSTLKAPKGQYNAFGKYKYRNCEDILEAVKPLLAEVKAVVIIGDELELIGSRFYVKATARFIDCETDAQITNTAYAREEDTKKGMDGSQITGASSSYARKYALNGLFAIDDTKDSDTTNGMPDQQNQQTANTAPQLMTEQHYNILIRACGNAQMNGSAEEFWKERYRVASLADIPDSQFEFMLTGMKCDKNGQYIGSR